MIVSSSKSTLKARKAKQLRLPFPQGKPLHERSPCEAENLEPERWVTSGYPADFNQHRYCERVYKGWRDEKGELHRCECLCHAR